MSEEPRTRIRFDRNELAGAFGDIGTDLPLIIGMILASGLHSSSVLVMFGLMQLFSAFLYGMPMAVQPLKAVAVIVITQHIAPDVLYGGGLAIGIAMLLLTVTGVGPKVALAIVGSRPTAEVQLAIMQQDQAVLVSIPGIGKKLAERVIFELKEKVAAAGVELDERQVAAEQRRDPAIAVASILAGELHDGLGECILIFTLCQLVALRAAWLVDQPARPPFTHALFLLMIHRTAPSFLVEVEFEYAARSDPPQATHQSPPDTGQASVLGDRPAFASPAAPRTPAPAAPSADAHHGGTRAHEARAPPDHDPF